MVERVREREEVGILGGKKTGVDELCCREEISPKLMCVKLGAGGEKIETQRNCKTVWVGETTGDQSPH